jgi:hypothetical protein
LFEMWATRLPFSFESRFGFAIAKVAGRGSNRNPNIVKVLCTDEACASFQEPVLPWASIIVENSR